LELPSKDLHRNLINASSILKKLSEKKDLSNNEAFDVVLDIIGGNCSDVFISSFLMGLIIKGEALEEIRGTFQAVQSSSLKILPIVNVPIIDNCGTGGDFLNTFNISTASAIVSSSCNNIAVAKHGNRSSSSLSGSADFFDCLGYSLNNSLDAAVKSIETIGFGFLFAPLFHPGLKRVANVRRELGLRTIFNKVGPLCNPCSNLYGQIIGVSDPLMLDIVPKIVPDMGIKKAMVVNSHDGMDELSICSRNTIIHVSLEDDVYQFNKTVLDPSDIGLPKSSLDEIVVKSKTESIVETLRVIYGMRANHPKENIVLLNTAASLLVGDAVTSLEDGIHVAKDSLDSGRPQKKLTNFIKNFGDISKLEAIEKLL
jgi:anthranilate phosphoribosyltransferase